MKVEDTAANAEKCLCPGCPTYNDCMREGDQVLFCARGETECQPKAVSCLCGGCPVWANYGLKTLYFCIEGAAS